MEMGVKTVLEEKLTGGEAFETLELLDKSLVADQKISYFGFSLRYCKFFWGSCKGKDSFEEKLLLFYMNLI